MMVIALILSPNLAGKIFLRRFQKLITLLLRCNEAKDIKTVALNTRHTNHEDTTLTSSRTSSSPSHFFTTRYDNFWRNLYRLTFGMNGFWKRTRIIT